MLRLSIFKHILFLVKELCRCSPSDGSSGPCSRHASKRAMEDWRSFGAGTPSHNCRLDECRQRARQAIAWLCGGVTESRKWLRVDRSREPTLGTVLETPDAMPDFRWLDQNWTVGKKLLTWFNEVLRLGPSLEI